MKKGLLVTAAALMCTAALSLTGCGSKPVQDAEFEPKQDTEEQVVLTVSGFFGNFEALDQVIADFNNYYPNVEVTYDQNTSNNFDEYISANPNVDIMMTSAEILEKMRDLIVPICADLEKADIPLQNIDKGMLSRGYQDEKLVAIPMGQLVSGLIVNVSLLEKEGLEIPKTYEEFISVLTALKEKGYTPIQGPTERVYASLVSSMLYDMILDDASLYEDLTAGKPETVEKIQPVIERLSELQSFMDPAVNAEYPPDNYDGAILKFFEGDVPFWVCNTENVSGMKKRETKSETFTSNPFTYTFIHAPLGDKGAYVFREPWFGFSLNQNAANYEYAAEFMRFLARKDEINKMANIKRIPSVATENEDLDIYKDIANPEKVELEAVNDGKITWSIQEKWKNSVKHYAEGDYDINQIADAFVEQFK